MDWRNILNQLNVLPQFIEKEKNNKYDKSKKIVTRLFQEIHKQIQIENSLECQNYLYKLIDNSIIICKEPRRLIKKGTSSQTGTQFDTSICSLLSSLMININIIDIKSFLVNCAPDGCLNRVEITSKLESLGKNSWILKNMRFRSVENKRSSKGTISEKSVLLFQVSLDVKTAYFTKSWIKEFYSNTVVVIVHSNQEAEAQLSLFVDDYFRIERLSFIEGQGFPYKSHTSPKELIEYISNYFTIETGRGLTDDNNEYLLKKVKTLFHSNLISINDFIKTPIHNTKLSFGLWIISIIRLCKNDHVKNLWLNGYIEGFISKDVGDLLQENGSFLLRFSERQAAVGVVMKSENNNINPWHPFTEVECRQNSIANYLSDFPCLKTIRKADGTFKSKNVALAEFMVIKNVDDGYTERGSFSSQKSFDEENYSVTTSNTQDFESLEDNLLMGDFSIDDMNVACLELMDSYTE